jgi:hypothetical protein
MIGEPPTPPALNAAEFLPYRRLLKPNLDFFIVKRDPPDNLCSVVALCGLGTLKTAGTYPRLGRFEMGKRDDLIARYAEDLKNKCGIVPDLVLLTKVTIGCGPSIYNADASTAASSQTSELETVKDNFLIKKLGRADGRHQQGAGYLWSL